MSAPAGFVAVPKDAFYKAIGRWNVHPYAEREYTPWRTPSGQVIGWTNHGFMHGNGPKIDGQEGFWVAPHVLSNSTKGGE